MGEVVFNTSLTGYQEILSDPSYARQLVTLTYPHIGSVGFNDEDQESSKIHASGLVVRDVPVRMSNWRSQGTLESYLVKNNIVAIAEIDTRKLTRILRDKGAQSGCIVVGSAADSSAALDAANDFPGLKGMDLAKEVTTSKLYLWSEGVWRLNGEDSNAAKSVFHVVAYDFGVKRNILRMLAERGCRVSVVPASTKASDALDLKPDGVFLSNGPGDPEPCDYAVEAIKEILEERIPVFGICLGAPVIGIGVWG